MQFRISVAIILGHLAIAIPGLYWWISLMVFAFTNIPKGAHVGWFIGGMVGAFILGGILVRIWWALIALIWRFLAFKWVPETHWSDLKRQATRKRLMADYDSFWDRLVLRSTGQAAKVDQLGFRIAENEQESHAQFEQGIPAFVHIPLSSRYRFMDLLGVAAAILVFGFCAVNIPEGRFLFVVATCIPFLSARRILLLIRSKPRDTLLTLDPLGIHYHYPWRESIFWKEIEFIDYHPRKRELTIQTNRNIGAQITLSANFYQIGATEAFEELIEVFVDRHLD